MRLMRSMARTEGENGEVRARTLIELKVVDARYPLYGAVTLSPDMPLAEALAERSEEHTSELQSH